ncbi:MAG: PmoA family protein [Thermoguttaceae bacterium]|jgi:hypothetical protein
MSKHATRREFLKVSLAAATASLGTRIGLAQTAPAAAKLSVDQADGVISVRLGPTLLTSYKYQATQKLPYLYPVAGPLSGRSLTTESAEPYPHHHSVFFGCDRVNDGNYWQGPLDVGQIVSTGARVGRVTDQSVEIVDRCEWRKPKRPVVMTDDRRFTITAADVNLRIIDADITWTAVQDVTVQKTNHSLFAVRAAADITPKAGGTLENSEGQKGEKATFGKAANWCTFYGKRQGVPGELVEGIALMYDPDNPWKDCPWFTRDYGFMSPSPFNFMAEPWQLAAGKSVKLSYRVLAYVGDPRQGDVQEIFKAWTQG